MDKKKKKEEKNVEQKQEVKEETTEILEEEHFKQPEEKSDTSKYEEEIKKLQEENKQLTEKVKLTQAELINYRKRKDEDVQTLLKYANVDSVCSLIAPIELYIKHVDNSTLSMNNFCPEISLSFLLNPCESSISNLTPLSISIGRPHM